jgi:hypothetical protein
MFHCNIAIILNATMAKKAINNGRMLISREQARYLFHDFEAERISFKDKSIMSAATPRTPSWEAPMVDVADIMPAELLITVLESMNTSHFLLSCTIFFFIYVSQ